MHSQGESVIGRLLSRQPPPIRDVYTGEAPEWAAATTARPSHEMTIRARLEQSRVVPLDLYTIRTSWSQVLVTAEVPGVTASEVYFAVDPGVLTICSETRPDQDDRSGGALRQLCREMQRGRFSQTLPLPDGLQIDRWSACFEEGTLILRIPKSRNAGRRMVAALVASLRGLRPAASTALSRLAG